jgi:hypothetical protein
MTNAFLCSTLMLSPLHQEPKFPSFHDASANLLMSYDPSTLGRLSLPTMPLDLLIKISQTQRSVALLYEFQY